MQLVLLFCFVLAAHSLAIEQRSCVSPEVLTVSKQVSDPHYFCAWYLKDGRTDSPILGINVNALLSACQCVVSVEPSGTEAKNLAAIQKAARLQSFVSATCPSTPANPITKQFTSPTSFCQFFASFERHDSPIPNLNVPAVRKACKCILSGPKISTSSMVKSTSKSSSSIKGSTSSVAGKLTSKLTTGKKSSTAIKSSTKTSSSKTTVSSKSSSLTKLSATSLSSASQTSSRVSSSSKSSSSRSSTRPSSSNISSSKRSSSSQPPCLSLRTTITTQALAITVTDFKTVTISAPTTTVVHLSTTTVSITDVLDVSYTSTDVATSISSDIITSQETVTNLETSTISLTQTVTTVSTTGIYLFSPKPAPTVQKRGPQPSSAVSACLSGTLTTTITVSAATTNSVSTIYFTPPATTLLHTSYLTANATRIVTSSHQNNATITSTIPTTVTSIFDPTTVDITVLETTTVTTTSTSFVAGPTRWCQMNLRASGGVVDGSYINTDTSSQVAVISPATSSAMEIYQLDDNGHVHPRTGDYAGQTWVHSGTRPYLYVFSDAFLAQYPTYVPYVCSVDSGTLEVFCFKQASASSSGISTWSDGYSTSAGQYLWSNSGTPQSGSTPFRLYADPVNCVS
ncbi:hypothetical protein D6D11_10396 [Aureobasidium pullulans]|nr:hypothetical protein D6D11_10396 [Aureobasidium pullulans]